MNNPKKTKKVRDSNLIIATKENALALANQLKEPRLMKINLKVTNINKQIKKIYTFFKPEIDSKGIQFFFKNSLPTKEAIFLTDPKKIYTVLAHLLKNAISNIQEGSIEFGYGGAKSTTWRTELIFFVKATGKVIPKERKKDITKHFTTAKTNNNGSLQENEFNFSSIKDYVALLGGKIWAVSEEGKDAKFYFTLPYRIDLNEKLLQC